MAMTTTRINGTCSLGRGYKYYADVLVWDNVQSDNTFRITINTYLENGGTRTNSSGWTKNITVASIGQETLTNETINTTTVDRNGGKVLLQNKTFNVPIAKTSISVSAYASKSSYSQYDPGYCSLSGNVSMPKVASMWSSSLLSIANVESEFTLPINKYVSTYYNVVEIRNSNNTILIRTINDAVDGTSVTFTNSELNTIYTMDNNVNQLPLRFYMDLKTYTDSSKEIQIGATQRLTCEAYIVNGEPTYTVTDEETDTKVLEVLGSNPYNAIAYASDIQITVVTSPKKGATISSVAVNGITATLESANTYVALLENVNYNDCSINVRDSRGLTASGGLTWALVEYIPLKINPNWTIERVNPVSSDLVLNAIIDAYEGYLDIDETISNEIAIKYSIDGINWTTIPSTDYTYANNKITITNLTLNNIVSYKQPATFYLQAIDLLTESNDNSVVAAGIETFSYGEHDLQVNGDLIICDEDGENPVNVLGMFKNEILWEDSEGILPAGETIKLSKNIYNYRFAIVEGQWGNKLIIPIIEGNTYFNGGMNYPLGGGNSMITTGLNATITNNGNDISFTYFRQLEHILNSNHGATFTNPKLYKIIGVK